MRRLATLVAFALLAAAPAFGHAETPTVAPLWTIRSPDCIGVDGDGEPWQECGFQAYDMNADGSRVITVSTLGTIQLWDGADGREIRRVDWTDRPGGAGGFPNGKAMILGDVAAVIVHQNQLILLNLADGSTRSQTVMDIMALDRIRRFGDLSWSNIDAATGRMPLARSISPAGRSARCPALPTSGASGRTIGSRAGRRPSPSIAPPVRRSPPSAPACRSTRIFASGARYRATRSMSSTSPSAAGATSISARPMTASPASIRSARAIASSP
jgi:hypothetical protein